MQDMTHEEMYARLKYGYGIENPTGQDIAMFALYGENAPFLKDRKPAQVANKEISGGPIMKDLQEILLNLRGTHQLLTLLCNATTEIKADINGNAQEALFQIEESLGRNVRDLERIIYKK